MYEAFEPVEARRIAERPEIHYTPKHGSWLNMAEIEMECWPGSAWTAGFQTRRRCAGRLTPGRTSATGHRSRVDWRFTTEDARIC